MNVCITGAAGFVGANLAARLVELGEDVHVIVRPSSRPWRLQGVADRLTVHAGDLNDADWLRQTLAAIRPEVVYHLAAHGAYHHQNDRDLILRTSVFGTLNLLNAAQAAGARLLVNTGSSSEYGTKDHPMREDEIIEPNSFYAVGKASQTLLSQQFAREEKFPVITLRLFSVYGPYEEPERLVPTLIRKALANADLPLARPDTARDFIYADDVVDAYLEAGRHPELSGHVFNVGSGTQSSLEEIVRNVLAITGSSSKPLWGAYPSRPFDTSLWVADEKKSSDLLGFRARTPLAEGLKKFTAWITEHTDAYQI